MNWMTQLGFDLNIPRINYGVYEQDILYFGGSVVYQGNVITETGRSRVEEAVITLDDFCSHAFMERFRDGSAALLFFIQEGAVSEEEIYPITDRFMKKMRMLESEDESYKIHNKKRQQKQGAVLLIQMVCILMALVAFIMSCNTGFAGGNVFVLVLALLLVFLWGRFYSCFRTREIKPVTEEAKNDYR